MTTYQFTVVIDPVEDGFHAYAPALPGCHSCGATVEKARANIVEAMELHLESLREDGVPILTEPGIKVEELRQLL